MPVDMIQGSVGMHHNGTTRCYNFPNDVAAIVRLLNLIDDAEGGISSTQLTASASPVQIFRAIRHFQQTQNDLGCLPKLSVDGHVDPGASTLSRLNQIARKIQPVQPEDIFLPPLREAIPGFDVTADEGTFVELPRQHVRPNGTVVTYLHADAKVTVGIENQRRRSGRVYDQRGFETRKRFRIIRSQADPPFSENPQSSEVLR
jgi:hypothetical protein